MLQEKKGKREPDWTREEIILALDLVRENNGRALDPSDSRVIQLSRILQRNPLHPIETRSAKFRNADGVARKTVDLVTSRPGYLRSSTKGGRETKSIAAEFDNDMERLQRVAVAIRSALEGIDYVPLSRQFDGDFEYEGDEGRLLFAKHLRRERSKKLRDKKIEQMRAKGRPIACEVCTFDFSVQYGQRGKDYIEVHHRVPLHDSGAVTTKLEDLVLLCSNCHRMIHRGNPWLTPDQLKQIVNEGFDGDALASRAQFQTGSASKE